MHSFSSTESGIYTKAEITTFDRFALAGEFLGSEAKNLNLSKDLIFLIYLS